MANQYTKLFIDGQEIDLFESEELPLNITKRVNNLEGKVQGDYSRASIKVPATKHNVSVLGDSRSFKPFRIEVDGSPSFNGTARIRKGNTFSQGYAAIKETYEINLVSNNSSWFVLLGETLLSELTDLKIALTPYFIELGFISEPDLRDFAFLFIKYKNWGIQTGTPPNIRYILKVIDDSNPALFIRPLIYSAFASIGYSVQSEFLESDFGKKLILPTPIPEKLSKAFSDAYLNLKCSLSAPVTFATVTQNVPLNVIDYFPPENPTIYDNVTTYNYTVPLDGYYKISIYAKLGTTVPVGSYSIIYAATVNNVGPVPSIGFGYTNIGPGAVPYPAGKKEYHEGVVFAQAGDTIQSRIQTNNTITIDEAYMVIEGEAVRTANMPVDFRFLLRDWKFVDMLKGLTAMFNLAFETDEDARTVTIEPKDGYVSTDRIAGTSQRKEGFYKQLEKKDYSKIIDYKRKGSFEFPNVAGRYDYIYKADDEPTIEFLEEQNSLKVYEARYSMSSGADTSKNEVREVPFFAKTIHVLDDLAKFPDTNVTPQFPLIYPTNYVLDPTATENKNEYLPRILYFAGQRFGYEEIDGVIETDTGPGVPRLVPMAFMVNYNDTTGLDPNLGFNNQTFNDVEAKGGLENYYSQEMVRLDKGEIRENYVQFNSVDNLVFSFRLKAYIDGQKYVVQEIAGFNPLKDAPTNFKFVLDVFPTQEDIDKIINTPVNSVVSLLSEIP